MGERAVRQRARHFAADAKGGFGFGEERAGQSAAPSARIRGVDSKQGALVPVAFQPPRDPKLDAELPRVKTVAASLAPLLPDVLCDIVAQYDSLPRPPYRFGMLAPLEASDPRYARLAKFFLAESIPQGRIDAFMSGFNGVELDWEAFDKLGFPVTQGLWARLAALGFTPTAVRIWEPAGIAHHWPDAVDSLGKSVARETIEVVRMESSDPRMFDFMSFPQLEEVHLANERPHASLPAVIAVNENVHVHTSLNRVFDDRVPAVNRPKGTSAIECATRQVLGAAPEIVSPMHFAIDRIGRLPNLRGEMALTLQSDPDGGEACENASFGNMMRDHLLTLKPKQSIAFVVLGMAVILTRDATPCAYGHWDAPQRASVPYTVEIEHRDSTHGFRVYIPMTHPDQMAGVMLSNLIGMCPPVMQVVAHTGAVSAWGEPARNEVEARYVVSDAARDSVEFALLASAYGSVAEFERCVKKLASMPQRFSQAAAILLSRAAMSVASPDTTLKHEKLFSAFAQADEAVLATARKVRLLSHSTATGQSVVERLLAHHDVAIARAILAPLLANRSLAGRVGEWLSKPLRVLADAENSARRDEVLSECVSMLKDASYVPAASKTALLAVASGPAAPAQPDNPKRRRIGEAQ
jgi:hypothetical protein